MNLHFPELGIEYLHFSVPPTGLLSKLPIHQCIDFNN